MTFFDQLQTETALARGAGVDTVVYCGSTLAENPAVTAVVDDITRRFEATVIGTALRLTHGRRIEAATRLGLGRNTITRKIQELRLEED